MSTLLATDPRVEQSDARQIRLGEGPSVNPGYLDDVLSSDDISLDGRWPTWGAAATDLGIAAIISVRLYSVAETTWGAAATDLGIAAIISVRLYSVAETTGILSLYFHAPRQITDDDRQVAALAGIHASIELHRRNPLHQQHRLWRTVESQHRIGQAQGILMEKLHISAAASFTVLHRLSQDTDTKIDDLVDQLLATRVLPGVTDVP